MQEIADLEKLGRIYVTRVVRPAFLAPDLIEAVVKRHKPDLKVKKFFSHLTMDWAEQRGVLGFSTH